MKQGARCRSRRYFLRVSLALASLSLVAGCGIQLPAAQPGAQVHRVGYLRLGADTPTEAERFVAFRDGLRDLGYLEGQNLVLEIRRTESPDRLPELAAELVRLPVDVIVAAPTRAAQVAKAATSTIPIVFPFAGDPVELGLVDSLARPGGNVTGLTQVTLQLAGKRLELLKEVVPSLTRVAVLWSATGVVKIVEHKELEAAAQVLGLQLQSLPIRETPDLVPALESALAGGAEALVPLADPLVGSQIPRIAQFASGHRLPTIFENRALVDEGGLLSYGPNIANLPSRAERRGIRTTKGIASLGRAGETPALLFTRGTSPSVRSP